MTQKSVAELTPDEQALSTFAHDVYEAFRSAVLLLPDADDFLRAMSPWEQLSAKEQASYVALAQQVALAITTFLKARHTIREDVKEHGDTNGLPDQP